MDDSILNGMTDEQLLTLIKSAGKEVIPPSGDAAPVSFKLGDGTEIQAKDNDELAKILGAKLEESYRKKETPAAPPVNPQTPPKWSMDEFAKRFTTDAADGMEYLETAKYGMPVGRAVPQLLAATIALAQKVQDMETESFTAAVPEYREPTFRSAIDGIMKERGWQPSRQSLQDASDIAKGRGMGPKETKKLEVLPFIPPRVSRSGAGENSETTGEEFDRAVQNMTTEKMEEILMQSGIIKTRRG